MVFSDASPGRVGEPLTIANSSDQWVVENRGWLVARVDPGDPSGESGYSAVVRPFGTRLRCASSAGPAFRMFTRAAVHGRDRRVRRTKGRVCAVTSQ